MKTPNHFRARLARSAAITLTSCSCTSTPPPPPAEGAAAAVFVEGVAGGTFVNTVEVSAKVTAIDRTTRKVTLMGSDGKKFKVKAGPEAINFDQVKVGDTVNATFTEELMVYVGNQNSAQSDGSAALVSLAPKGAQPGGVMAEVTQVTGKITAIDTQNRTATLRFEDGTEKTLPVRSDIDLSRHKVGENVVFQVTEMVALSVTKP